MQYRTFRSSVILWFSCSKTSPYNSGDTLSHDAEQITTFLLSLPNTVPLSDTSTKVLELIKINGEKVCSSYLVYGSTVILIEEKQ